MGMHFPKKRKRKQRALRCHGKIAPKTWLANIYY